MPLVARASVTHGVKVVVTVNHLNRTATSGYVARLVLLLFYYLRHATLSLVLCIRDSKTFGISSRVVLSD